MLGRHVEAQPQGLQKLDDADVVRQGIGGRVHPDDRVARAHQQAVEGRDQDALGRIGRMVRLVAGGEASGQADRGAEARHDRPLGGHRDEVLQPADLGDRRDHLGGEAGREGGERPRVGGGGEQPLAEGADREGRDRREGRRVVPAGDQVGDLVLLRGDQLLGQEGLQRQVRQRDLRGQALHRPVGAEAGELVAGPLRRRLGEQAAQVGEGEACAFDRRRVGHGGRSRRAVGRQGTRSCRMSRAASCRSGVAAASTRPSESRVSAEPAQSVITPPAASITGTRAR